MLISVEQMRHAIIIPVSEQCIIDWESISSSTKQWVGGMIDGDGSIACDAKHGLRVSVKQAELGWTTLEHLKTIFGGHVYANAPAKGKWQAQRTWNLSGRSALSFCIHMEPFVYLKRHQLQIAKEYPVDELKYMQMKPVTAIHMDTHEEVTFGSTQHAAKSIARSGRANILKCLKKPNSTAGNYFWQEAINPVKVDEVIATRDDVISRLKMQKHIAHDPITEQLPLPYIAGMVDSDGCLGAIIKGTQRHSVGQKYSAICNALRNQFGGSVTPNTIHGTVFVWQVGGANAVSFLNAIFPYLIEKRQQAEIINSLDTNDAKTVLARLQKLKGNQGIKVVYD
jgi:hypothetical protein